MRKLGSISIWRKGVIKRKLRERGMKRDMREVETKRKKIETMRGMTSQVGRPCKRGRVHLQRYKTSTMKFSMCEQLGHMTYQCPN